MKMLLFLQTNPSSTCTNPIFISHLTRIHGFSTAKTQNPSPNSSYIVHYLVDKCGFSSGEAIKASRSITHIKSPSGPDSVIRFLKDTGMNDTQIRILLSKCPGMLCASVERTLEPRIKALREMGFSESELVQLLEIPDSLRIGDLQPKIELLKSLYGNNKDLLKAVRRNNDLLRASLDKTIMPSISLLKETGISDCRIAKFLSQTRFFNTSNIKASIERAEELGFSRSSRIFAQAVRAVISTSRSTVIAKLRFLRSLGWSEAEVLCAIRKQPTLLNISENKMHATMRFLTKEAGYQLSYIARRPKLLCFSLERRLVPRFYVMRFLKQKQLIVKKYNILTYATPRADKFIEKFILPYEVNVPGLCEAYIAACKGDIPDQWKASEK